MTGPTPTFQETDLEGLLIGTEWDNEGRPKALLLSSAKEREYVVNRNHNFERLIGHTGQFLRINGLIQTCGGRPSISIESFSVLPNLLSS